MAIPHQMTTTQFELDGYQITRSMGIVRGIIVRSRSLIGTIGAGLQTLVGGNITLLTELCEKTRACGSFLRHAQAQGPASGWPDSLWPLYRDKPKGGASRDCI